MSAETICPNCESTNVHEHDNYCDDEHDPDDGCFSFYCNDCGEGFEVEP